MLGGAMISLWVGCWRSQVPSVKSPECVEGKFSEVHAELCLVASCLLWIGTTCQTSGSERRTASERSGDAVEA